MSSFGLLPPLPGTCSQGTQNPQSKYYVEQITNVVIWSANSPPRNLLPRDENPQSKYSLEQITNVVIWSATSPPRNLLPRARKTHRVSILQNGSQMSSRQGRFLKCMVCYLTSPELVPKGRYLQSKYSVEWSTNVVTLRLLYGLLFLPGTCS